jgi:hypothetical protein
MDSVVISRDANRLAAKAIPRSANGTVCVDANADFLGLASVSLHRS